MGTLQFDRWLNVSMALTLTLLVTTIVGAPQPQSYVDAETRLSKLEQDTSEIKDALKQLIMTLSVTMNDAKEIEEHRIAKRDVTETANETATETASSSANMLANETVSPAVSETSTPAMTSSVTQRPTGGPTEGADDLQSVLTGFVFNVNGLVAILNAKDKVYNDMVNERINEEVASLIQNLTEYRTHMDDKFVNLTRVVENNEQAIAAAISDVEQNERDISAVNSGLSSVRSSIQSNGGRISSLNSQLQNQIPLIASNAQCPCWNTISPCRADSIENNYIKNCKSGYIVSPNYPSNYGNFADYQWDVENPGYGTLKITWLHYEVETRGGTASDSECSRPYDYFEVITTYICTAGSGSSTTHSVSELSTIPMKFISDGGSTRKGFKLKFEFS